MCVCEGQRMSSVSLCGRVLVDNPVCPTAALINELKDWLYCDIDAYV